MLKVTIERPDVKGTITLTMHEAKELEDLTDLKDLLRFLTEVARATGFSYIEDLAALTEYRIVPGTETEELWKHRLKNQKKKPIRK